MNEHSISCEVVVGRVLCTNFGAGVAEDGVPVRYADNIGWANGQPRRFSGDPGRAFRIDLDKYLSPSGSRP